MRALFIAPLIFTACSNDPLYIPSPMPIEAGTATAAIAQTSLILPIRRETSDEMMERVARTADLMVDVPYVKVGDIEISVEWKITNLTGMDGEVLLQLNGANQEFAYDPVANAVGLDEDEPQPPGLEGDVPLHIGPMGTLTGLFREDQVREASIDLDQITRANINPFRATLTVQKNATEFAQLSAQTYDAQGEPLPQTATGVVFPREAFRSLVRVDLVFKPDRQMRLEYTVRVRDVRGIMHELLDAAFVEEPDELEYPATFMPTVFTPPVP